MLEREPHAEIGRQAERADDLRGADSFGTRHSSCCHAADATAARCPLPGTNSSAINTPSRAQARGRGGSPPRRVVRRVEYQCRPWRRCFRAERRRLGRVSRHARKGRAAGVRRGRSEPVPLPYPWEGRSGGVAARLPCKAARDAAPARGRSEPQTSGGSGTQVTRPSGHLQVKATQAPHLVRALARRRRAPPEAPRPRPRQGLRPAHRAAPLSGARPTAPSPPRATSPPERQTTSSRSWPDLHANGPTRATTATRTVRSPRPATHGSTTSNTKRRCARRQCRLPQRRRVGPPAVVTSLPGWEAGPSKR
jgi:hypothetical protein